MGGHDWSGVKSSSNDSIVTLCSLVDFPYCIFTVHYKNYTIWQMWFLKAAMYSMKFSLHSDDIVILSTSIIETVCHSVPLSGKAGGVVT